MSHMRGVLDGLTDEELSELAEAIRREQRRRVALTTTYGPNMKTSLKHILGRYNLTLEEAQAMTDDELLGLYHFGKKTLAYLRSTA